MQLNLQKAMTQFEKLLEQAKTRKEILHMQNCLVDNLTEEEIISLKARKLGVKEVTVKNLLARSTAVKEKNWKRLLEKSQDSIIAVIA